MRMFGFLTKVFPYQTTTMIRFVLRMFDQRKSVVLKRPSMQLTPSPLKSLETKQSPYIMVQTISHIVFRIREVIQLGTDFTIEK